MYEVEEEEVVAAAEVRDKCGVNDEEGDEGEGDDDDDEPNTAPLVRAPRDSLPRLPPPPSSSSLARRGRFLVGILSPVDCRMASSVCQPGVEKSWYVSARSWAVATRHRRASSSCYARTETWFVSPAHSI